MTTNPNRVPKGVPTGGQFATGSKAESGDTLTLPPADESTAEPSIVDRDTIYTKKYDTLEEKVEALHGEIADHVKRMGLDQQDWLDHLDALSKFHHYSFQNQILIALQTKGEATHVAGFRKWQDEFERHVKKGEKGIQIFAPKIVNKKVTDANGKPVLDAKGKPKKDRVCVGFTTATVFDISQTDGKPLPPSGMELSIDPPEGFREDLENAITEAGFTVEYGPTGAANGYTDPVSKTVRVNPNMSPANQASTLAHELGHIKAGHLERIDEYHTAHGGSRGEFEVEADSISYVLCRANGMEPEVGNKTGRYIASWSQTAPDTDLVRKTGENVQRAVKDLLGSGSWRNATE